MHGNITTNKVVESLAFPSDLLYSRTPTLLDVHLIRVLSCGLIHLGKLCLNWKFMHLAIGRPTLPIHIQSVTLKNMELWWLTIAFWIKIASMISTGFSMQLDGGCSVHSILLFTHADQLSILAPNHEKISHDSASESIPITLQVFTYFSGANTEVHGDTILHWKILRRAEFEGSENYSNDSTATGKRYVIIIGLHTNIYCSNTTAQQSGIGM